uniref:Uncharacterized protein n=1 Tax=Brassica oleracea var. oleracea TaxID=109376 RepID=A0A0D3BI28_BRAOL
MDTYHRMRVSCLTGIEGVKKISNIIESRQIEPSLMIHSVKTKKRNLTMTQSLLEMIPPRRHAESPLQAKDVAYWRTDRRRPTNMGQDYSYTQPSSEEFDINSLLEAEAALYGDEAQSSYIIAEADQYPPEPEADEGIPRTCYCGSEVVVETSATLTMETPTSGNDGMWRFKKSFVKRRHNLGWSRINSLRVTRRWLSLTRSWVC